MQFKPIKEYKKIDVPTKKESQNKLLKFLIEHKNLTYSMLFLFFINSKCLAIIPEPTDQVIAGGEPSEPSFVEIIPGLSQWIIIFSSIIYIIYKVIFNIINLNKIKNLDIEEKKAYKKKHIKSFLIKIGICFLLVCILGVIK